MLRALIFVAALISLVGPCCSAHSSEATRTGEAVGGMSDVDSDTLLARVQEAFAQRDFDAAYRLLLTAESEDSAEATFDVAFLLMGGLEMSAHTKQGTAPWYRSDLMKQQFPIEERIRVGLIWLRRGAYLGSTRALKDLAFYYHSGLLGLPADRELSACFEEASKDKSKIPACREMEQARGYVPGARRQRDPPPDR